MRKTSAKTEQRKDVYQKITDNVVANLEAGVVMWKQPWSNFGLPQNFVSKRRYNGFNLFYLNMVAVSGGFRTPYFLTFKQAKDLGGTIRKGEHGATIIYYAQIKGKQIKVVDGKEVEEPQNKLVPVAHTVFNVDQTGGIETPQIDTKIRTDVERIALCEKVIKDMPQKPLISISGQEAYYMPRKDLVNVPDITRFETDEDYYKTIFHELAHSTGHESRLNRKELMGKAKFGSEDYSKEELTAEMTAAFLAGVCGIDNDHTQNSTAYIQGWLKVLKDDKRMVLKAASNAQKAADFILNENE